MISDANKAVNDLASIVPLLGGSSSRKDYEEARKLVEYLLEHDPDSPLVDMLTARIDAWEDNAVEFEEFNTRIEAGKNGVSLLRVGVWGAMEPKTNVRVYHRRSVPSSHA
ncbi:hypothetical protein ACOQKP_27650, partial [Klebsiella pneumoniae]